jgi:outer membrane protein assembly factor BamD (BamD/ComL family)
MPKETSKEDTRRNPLVVWVGHTIHFLQERRRIALGILVAVVVMAGAGAGYFWYQERQEREAQALLAKTQAALRGEKPGTPGNSEEAAKGLAEVVRRFPGTSAAEESLVRLGNMQYDGGKYEDAVATFSKYLATYGRGNFRILAGIGKAYAEDAKGDHQAPVKTLSELVATVKDDPLLGEAYSDLARFYEEAKKPEDALRVYGQIAERFPRTQWEQRALRRMGALKAK